MSHKQVRTCIHEVCEFLHYNQSQLETKQPSCTLEVPNLRSYVYTFKDEPSSEVLKWFGQLSLRPASGPGHDLRVMGWSPS